MFSLLWKDAIVRAPRVRAQPLVRHDRPFAAGAIRARAIRPPQLTARSFALVSDC
jgi:hypothetical protein